MLTAAAVDVPKLRGLKLCLLLRVTCLGKNGLLGRSQRRDDSKLHK